MVALYARANHPRGWGEILVDGYDESKDVFLLKSTVTTAHGYSMLAIECDNEEQFLRLQDVLQGANFQGITDETTHSAGFLGEWFGGEFELLGRVEGAGLKVFGRGDDAKRFFPYGDNKNFAIFTAEQVFAALA